MNLEQKFSKKRPITTAIIILIISTLFSIAIDYYKTASVNVVTERIMLDSGQYVTNITYTNNDFYPVVIHGATRSTQNVPINKITLNGTGEIKGNNFTVHVASGSMATITSYSNDNVLLDTISVSKDPLAIKK